MRHPSAALLRAYARTDYTAETAQGIAVARIGRRSAAIDAALRGLGARQGGFVTAWNPFSRPAPEGWNHRMQARLRGAARRLPAVEGSGIGRGWSERHVLLVGDPRRIWRLALRFRQAAIVLVRIGAPARLRHRGHGRRWHGAERAVEP